MNMTPADMIRLHFQQVSFSGFLTARGAVVYPADKTGKPAAKLTDESFHIKNRDQLKHFLARDFSRFVFRPADAGLVAFDLDTKDGKNGPAEFIRLTGIDPEAGFYVRTPSGGLHIYFFAGGQDYVSAQLPGGIDIKYRALLTIPGSRSNKGKYQAHGYPYQIKKLPESVVKISPVKKQVTTPQPEPATGEALGLDRIMDTLLKQGESYAAGNRNYFSFQFSKFARKQRHRPDDVQEYLSFLVNNDFQQRELSATINSAFSRGRK